MSQSIISEHYSPSIGDIIWGATLAASELAQIGFLVSLDSEEEALVALTKKVATYSFSAMAGYLRAKSPKRALFETEIFQFISGKFNLDQHPGFNLVRDFFNGFCLGNIIYRATNAEEYIIHEDRSNFENSSSSSAPYEVEYLTADELKAKLDAKIIGQDKAKKKIIQAIQLHQLTEGSSTPKPARIMLIGPTGSGKSATVKALAESLNRPFITVDGASLSPEGYRGTNFSQVWGELVDNAGGSKKLAEKGIVFIDEADKLFDKNTVSTERNYRKIVQQQLLKVLEGSEVQYSSRRGLSSINTEEMIFVLGGVFENLPKASQDSEVTVDQLEAFGVSRELTGRLSDIAQLNPLGASELRKILNSKETSASIIKWKNLFKQMKCQLTIEPEVIDAIIDYAVRKQTGARGLDAVVRQFLNPYLEKVQNRFLERVQYVPASRVNRLPLESLHLSLNDWEKTDMAKQNEYEHAYPSLEEIQGALESEVIGQEEAKRVVSQAVYLQQLNIAEDLGMPKGNLLMIGPSGCGKTYMMEVLSKKLNIPLSIMDASKIVRAGLVGSRPEDAIVKLLENCNGDIKAAEKGIIVLDEMDKVFDDARDIYGTSVSGRSVLNQLLRLLQGDQVTVKYQGQDVTVDTTNVQFVLAGAFSKAPHLYSKDALEEEDFLRAGLTPEFLGRIGYKTRLEEIGEAEFRAYLKGPSLEQWKQTFERIGANLVISEAAINSWIEQCLNNQTGIRGLQNLVRTDLSDKLVEAKQRVDQGESLPKVQVL